MAVTNDNAPSSIQAGLEGFKDEDCDFWVRNG